MNNYVPFHKGTPQYEWAMKEFASVDRKMTPWLFVQVGNCLLGSGHTAMCVLPVFSKRRPVRRPHPLLAVSPRRLLTHPHTKPAPAFSSAPVPLPAPQFHAPPYHTYYTHYKEMDCFLSVWEDVFYE